MKAQKFIPLLLIVVGLVAYHNIFPNAFVFDDHPNIVENPRLRHLWPPWEILTHSSRPVVTLSLATNYALGGLIPWGYHAVNVTIHILAALTLYGVVRRTLSSERLRARWAGDASWLAGLAALLWEVHPLQTESVTYTIQRGESLMGLFYLLLLYCVIRSRESARAGHWQWAAVVSCALGMASKQVMISAPVVMLLYDRVFWARSWDEIRQRRWRLYAGLAATWLLLPVLLAAPPENPEFHDPTAGFAFKGITPGEYALTQPGVILHYLRLVFWPAPLCLDYGWHYGWPLARSVNQVLPGLLVVGGLLVATVWAWRRQPVWGFLGAWFFLILAVTSSFVPFSDVVFEHRMYLSLAAVVVLVVIGSRELARSWLGRHRRWEAVCVWSIGGAVVLVLTALTVQRNVDYRSDLSIWQDTVRKCPNNPRALGNLGKALLEAGDTEGAIRRFEQAIRLYPSYPEAHHNLGLSFHKLGRVQEAIAHYNQALRFKPDFAVVHNNLGNLLVHEGKIQDGIQHLEQALRLRPDYPEANYNLGVALSQITRFQEAIAYYARAIQLQPDYAEAHNNWGTALLQLGKPAEALGHIEQALRIKPDYTEAHCNLALVYSRTGRPDDAIRAYEKGLQLKPDSAEAHCGLGILLAQTGKLPEAIQHFEEAVHLKPDYADAHNNLGNALMLAGRTRDAIAHYERALQIKPDFADAKRNLARAQAALQAETDRAR